MVNYKDCSREMTDFVPIVNDVRKDVLINRKPIYQCLDYKAGQRDVHILSPSSSLPVSLCLTTPFKVSSSSRREKSGSRSHKKVKQKRLASINRLFCVCKGGGGDRGGGGGGGPQKAHRQGRHKRSNFAHYSHNSLLGGGN